MAGTAVLRDGLDNNVASGFFPSAGDTLLDDDGDDNDPGNDGPTAPGDNFATGITHADDFAGVMAPPLQIPPSVHPLDFSGLGNYGPISALTGGTFGTLYRDLAPGFGGVRDLRGVTADPQNPARFPFYGTEDPVGSGTYVPALMANQDSGTFPINGITPLDAGRQRARRLADVLD